jgi:hypothetical protein
MVGFKRLPPLDTSRPQLKVLRQQGDVPTRTLDRIDQHIGNAERITDRGLRADREAEELALLKAGTITGIIEDLAAEEQDARDWLAARTAEIDTPQRPYRLTSADDLILRVGSPDQLRDLVERSHEDPTVKQAVILRLEEVCRRVNDPTSAAFRALVSLRSSPSRVTDRTTKLRDLEIGAARRLTLRRAAIVRAAQIINILPHELERSARHAAHVAAEEKAQHLITRSN